VSYSQFSSFVLIIIFRTFSQESLNEWVKMVVQSFVTQDSSISGFMKFRDKLGHQIPVFYSNTLIFHPKTGILDKMVYIVHPVPESLFPGNRSP
jgi:hypothetical protein